MGCLYFTEDKVVDFTTAKTCDTEAYARFFHKLLDERVYLAPSQFEAYFFSSVHGPEELGATLSAYRKALEMAFD